MRSMTAYARGISSSSLGRFVMEIQSVNRKGLDVSMDLPNGFARFEMQLRKRISFAVERGQVVLRLVLETDKASPHGYTLSSLKRLKHHWEQVAQELGYPHAAVDLPFLSAHWKSVPPSFTEEEETELRQILDELVLHALTQLLEMKQEEGAALGVDLKKRLDAIEESRMRIEQRKAVVCVHYKEKIGIKLAQMGTVNDDLQGRLLKEVALLAEKSDITEELVRLRIHLEKAQQMIRSSSLSVGRTLDFLAQEMHREMNTLAAKSADSDIALHCVTMKSELEKIREQVQNIE